MFVYLRTKSPVYQKKVGKSPEISSNRIRTHMITIQFSPGSDEISPILEKIEELTLAHRLEEKLDLEYPKLVDHEICIEGVDAILAYLLTIEGELKSWYFCACD